MLQNVLHSGQFWLPSYAARRWESGGAIIVPDEFPVPGMQFSYLLTTGRRTLLFFADKYGWWGLGLLAVGLGWAVRRREVRVLLLLLPALLTNLLFYSFYYYVKGRYLFVVDLFAVPIM
jgi:MYXO-CTERM domain-containing protein